MRKRPFAEHRITGAACHGAAHQPVSFDQTGISTQAAAAATAIRQAEAGCSSPTIWGVITKVMLEIVKDGLIEGDDQLSVLVQKYGQVVMPNEDDDLDLTHWWVIRDDGVEALYVGTEDTFATYVRERNGGLQ